MHTLSLCCLCEQHGVLLCLSSMAPRRICALHCILLGSGITTKVVILDHGCMNGGAGGGAPTHPSIMLLTGYYKQGWWVWIGGGQECVVVIVCVHVCVCVCACVCVCVCTV